MRESIADQVWSNWHYHRITAKQKTVGYALTVSFPNRRMAGFGAIGGRIG